MRRLLLALAVLFAVAASTLLAIPLLFVGGADGACVAAGAAGPAATALDYGREIVVGASEFGGPGDPGTGSEGYRRDDLTGQSAFAELSTNWQQEGGGWDYAALGDLPHGTRLRISVTVHGRTRSIVASKLDIGRGGPPIDGHLRTIDLWWETANALGLDGTSGLWSGVVRIQRTRAPVGRVGEEAACDDAALPAGPLARRIVQVARAELAKGISEPGNNCVPYNHCDGQPWCASFVSFVWDRAGVPMPYIAASNMIWVWASQHARVLGPTERPQPGDAILYGSGPQSTSTSVHVGVVETVGPDGRITTIEGNLSDRVKHSGPFYPRDAQGAGEPGPVYAYARPTGS